MSNDDPSPFSTLLFHRLHLAILKCAKGDLLYISFPVLLEERPDDKDLKTTQRNNENAFDD